MSSKVENDTYWKERKADDTRKDWADDAPWIEGYYNSRTHPHRQLIIDAIKRIDAVQVYPVNSVLEIGCSCAPNLIRIHQEFPSIHLAGIDVNEDAVRCGHDRIIAADVRIGNAKNIPHPDQSFDIVLSDATFLYISPQEIDSVMNEIRRIARKGVILVEWDSKSPEGTIKNFHWARDYKKLLEQKGFKVEKRKITKEDWPNESWSTHGYMYSATR